MQFGEYTLSVSDIFIIVTLSMIRMGAYISFSPVLRQGSAPKLIRTNVIVAFSLLIMPLSVEAVMNASQSELVMLFIYEFVIGMILSFVIWLPYHSLEMAGVMIDTQQGQTMGQDMNVATGGMATEQGKMYSRIFLTYLFTTGLFTTSLGMLYTTFEYVPLLSLEVRQILTVQEIVISIIGDIFGLALQLAFPLMGALLISDICVGFVARFAQQLQALSFNLPVKALIDMVFQVTYFFVIYDYAAQVFSENINLVEVFMQEMGQIK